VRASSVPAAARNIAAVKGKFAEVPPGFRKAAALGLQRISAALSQSCGVLSKMCFFQIALAICFLFVNSGYLPV